MSRLNGWVKAALAFAVLTTIAGTAFAVRWAGFKSDLKRLDEQWRARPRTLLRDLGSTRSLTILPLVDYHASDAGLSTDVGVAYLVKTDDATILFDVGNNSRDDETSPVERNLAALGRSLSEIDSIVLSHAHFDHVGGRRWTKGSLSGTTFGFGHRQPSMGDKRIFTPVDMQYPGSAPQRTTVATRIATGIATTGVIARRLFPEIVEEQALAIHVEGKGLVVIVGCGHQTLARLLESIDATFVEPLYGIVGGLHLPVPEGRIKVAGLDMQRIFGSGDGPFAPLNANAVDAELGLLEKRGLGLIAVGGHDSIDDVIAKVQVRFGESHRTLRVGEPIVVEASQPTTP